MGLRARKVFRFGPFRWHWTLGGPSSWSFKLGAWSWNSRTQRHRVDLPGGMHWVEDKRRQVPVRSTKGQGLKRVSR